MTLGRQEEAPRGSDPESPVGPSPRPRRVLVMHSSYLTGSASGENRVVEDEIMLLRRRGHTVSTWTPSPPETGMLSTARLGGRALWSLEATRELERIVHRDAPDVVHFHNLFPMVSPAVIRTARRAGIPVVLTLHNFRLLCLPATFLRDGRPCEDCLGRVPWPGVIHKCYRGSAAASGALAASLSLHRAIRTFDGVNLFLAVSELVRRKHLEAGIPPERVIVKPNFAWGGPVREGGGEYFVYLGRLWPEKGLEVLMDAWRDVGAPLWIVGEGELRPRLEAMAPDTVRFVGQVDAVEARKILARARALLLPSICYEGAPRSIPEAYASAVPVIASRIGSIPQFLEEGATGLLVPPGNSGALAEAARGLLDDERSLTLGAQAYDAWRERFTPERGAAELEAAYERALGEAASTRAPEMRAADGEGRTNPRSP